MSIKHLKIVRLFHNVIDKCCCGSVTHLSSTSWDPMDCSTPGFPVLHCLSEAVQTHVHWVSDAIQQSHLLLPLSPPALNLYQLQDCFQWVGLALSIRWSKYWSFSFNISPSNEHPSPLGWTSWISLQSKGLSRVFSSTTIQKHQFFSAQPS